MFSFVQEKKRVVQVIFAIIVLPFALWGVESYTQSGGKDLAATVNDTQISQQEYRNALRQHEGRLRQQLGERFDPALLQSAEIQREVMDSLVSQKLMLENARDLNLLVADEQIAKLIGGIEVFQNEGKFDQQQYESSLANQRLSPLMFEARVRDEMLWQQIQEAYSSNGYASNSVVENIIRLNEQQRKVGIYPISFESYIGQATVDEDALKKYYNQNMQEFQLGERAIVEFVKFSMDGLLAKIEIDNEEVRSYYNEHQAEFGTPEERQAAHILISLDAMASKNQQDAAREKTEQLLQEIKSSPDSFAELAKNNSQDPGSAGNGGDLGFIGRGMMVKPFEDAVFALQDGEISGVVQSEFGYHIIKLIAVKPSKAIPFDQVENEISSKMREQKAFEKYAELAEEFNNTVYEQSDTLQPAAELIGGNIEQSGWLTKGTPSGEPWTSNMMQAIFTDEITSGKRNTSAIEVAPNTLVAARVLEYKPIEVQPFADIKDLIQQKLLLDQASMMAAEQGKETLEKLLSGGKPKLSWEPVQTITRAEYGSLDAVLVKKIFQTNIGKTPHYIGVDSVKGYMLVRIDEIKDGEAKDEEKLQRYAQQLRQLTGDEMFRAYLANARQNATIKINLAEAPSGQP